MTDIFPDKLNEIEALIFNKDRNGIERKQRGHAHLCHNNEIRHHYYRHSYRKGFKHITEHRSFCTPANAPSSRLTSSKTGVPCPGAKGASWPDRGRPDDARKYSLPGESDKGALLKCDYSNLNDNQVHHGFIVFASKKPPSGGSKVTLHEHGNFGGIRRDFGPGHYNLHDGKYQPSPSRRRRKNRRYRDWGDSVSSIQIAPFTKLEMWEHGNFSGNYVQWVNDTYEWRKFPNMGSHYQQKGFHNDYVSSIKVHKINPPNKPQIVWQDGKNFKDTPFIKDRNKYNNIWNHLADEFQLIDPQTKKPLTIQQINDKSSHMDKKTYKMVTKDKRYEVKYTNDHLLKTKTSIAIGTPNTGSLFNIEVFKENVIRLKESTSNKLLFYNGLTDFTLDPSSDNSFRLKFEYTSFEQNLHYISLDENPRQYSRSKNNKTVFGQLKNIYCKNAKNMNKVVDLQIESDGIIQTCALDKGTELSKEKVEAYCLENPTDLKCACYNKNKLDCSLEKNKEIPGCKEYNNWQNNLSFLAKGEKGKQLLKITMDQSKSCIEQNICEQTPEKWRYGAQCQAPTNIQACIQDIKNVNAQNKGDANISNQCNLSLEQSKKEKEKEEKKKKYDHVKTKEEEEYENAGKPKTDIQIEKLKKKNDEKASGGEQVGSNNNTILIAGLVVGFLCCIVAIAMAAAATRKRR